MTGRIREAWRVLALVVMLGMASGVGAEVPASSSALSLYPLVLGVPQPPQPVAGSDRRTHLTWEVLATNTGMVALDVASVEVHDGIDGRLLLRHAGEALAAHMSPLPDPSKRISRIEPGMTAVLWFDLALDPATAPPSELDTRVFGVGAGPQGTGGLRIKTPVDAKAPRTLSPPLSGARWAAFEACCDAANHHRRGLRAVDGQLRLPERYAIDFVQLAADASLFRGDGKRNEDYYGFGQPVLAVADAVVVDVFDTLADRAPGLPLPPPTLPEAGGNHVILDLGDGVWAMYGHLKAHSIRVEPGQRVRSGQVIAALGNNGNSDLPHLHFQLMDTRNFALSQGLPFVLDAYRLVGIVDLEKDRIAPAPEPRERRAEMPLNLTVLDFPSVAPD